MTSLGEELRKEMARVRDVVLPAYLEVLKFSPSTAITIAWISADLDRATKALAGGDTVECIRVYEKLKEWDT